MLYRDGNGVHVMDAGTYDQYTLDEETVGDQAQWLEPGVTFQAEWLNGAPDRDPAAGRRPSSRWSRPRRS